MRERELDGLGEVPSMHDVPFGDVWMGPTVVSDATLAEVGRRHSPVQVHLDKAVAAVTSVPAAPTGPARDTGDPNGIDPASTGSASPGVLIPDDMAFDHLGRSGGRVGGLRVRKRAGFEAMAMDLLGLLVAFVVASFAVAVVHEHRAGSGGGAVFGGELLRLLVCVPVFGVALSGSRSPLRTRLRTTVGREIGQVAGPVAAGGLGALVLWRALQVGGVTEPSVDALLLTCLIGTVTVGMCRFVHHASPTRGGRRVRRVVIVGTGMVADRVAERLGASGDADIVGFVDDDPLGPDRWLGPLRDLEGVCANHHVDHVVVAFSRVPAEQVVEALRPMQGRLPISVVPRLFDVVPSSATMSDLGSGLPAVSVAPATLGWGPLMVKRSMDVVGACVAIVLLSPVLAVAALAVRLSSTGPVLLRQVRIGRDGCPFTMYKFRTMCDEGGSGRRDDGSGDVAVGPFHKLKRDPRVTGPGRLLRRTSIDELPQLVNVLAGQMALVGPRPFIPEDSVFIDGWANRRYSVKPGITGLWQVSGRNDITFEEMCRLDQLYVASWSVGLDVRILFKTLRVVLTGHGAY